MRLSGRGKGEKEMGRPRKPTALLEISGAVRKNPQRYRDRAGEPVGNPDVGEPPAEFLNVESSIARKRLEIWHRFLAEAPPGCITGSDRTLLANACRLQQEIEYGGKVSPAKHGQMQRYLAALGLTGEGRAKRGAGDPARRKAPAAQRGGESAWARLAGEAAAARL